MKKKNIVFFKPFLLLLFLSVLLFSFVPRKTAREYYRLTVYHYSTLDQEKLLDRYLAQALLPALHRMNHKTVGVFKAIANDTSGSKLLYVLTPISSPADLVTIQQKLEKDNLYQSAAAEYNSVPYTAPAYTRMENILLLAFPLAPQHQVPRLNAPKNERVYELRSYEGASESIFRNKVKMFNDGDEVGLFKRLNFNAVFYSEVIAGSKMPNLMYMTTFENMADRDAHWKTFGADSAWKKLSSMPEYQHNVSHIDITFLRPTEYSDL